MAKSINPSLSSLIAVYKRFSQALFTLSTFAQFSRSKSAISLDLFFAAIFRAEFHSLSKEFVFILFLSNSFIKSIFPFSVAICNSVEPELFTVSILL
jgi:hypothetical protein